MENNLSIDHRKSKGGEAPVRKSNDFFEIFYTISHERRTPLTLSIGPLEEVLRGGCGKIGRGVQDQVGLALRNNRRLLKLVNYLLVFARLESGVNMSIQPEEISINFFPVLWMPLPF